MGMDGMRAAKDGERYGMTLPTDNQTRPGSSHWRRFASREVPADRGWDEKRESRLASCPTGANRSSANRGK